MPVFYKQLRSSVDFLHDLCIQKFMLESRLSWVFEYVRT